MKQGDPAHVVLGVVVAEQRLVEVARTGAAVVR